MQLPDQLAELDEFVVMYGNRRATEAAINARPNDEPRRRGGRHRRPIHWQRPPAPDTTATRRFDRLPREGTVDSG